MLALMSSVVGIPLKIFQSIIVSNLIFVMYVFIRWKILPQVTQLKKYVNWLLMQSLTIQKKALGNNQLMNISSINPK